jgi:hypothetical protein
MPTRIFAAIMFLTLFVQSCVFNPFNYTYIQTPVNIPNLEEKGDLHVDGYAWANHADLQASYAPTNNVGVMASYNKGYKDAINYGDVGIGYFTNKDHLFRLNFFVGAGLGDLAVTYKSKGHNGPLNSEYVYDLSSHYTKLFIQPSLGVNISEKITLTSTFKLSYVNFQAYSYLLNYNDYDSIGGTRVLYDTWQYRYETTKPEHVFILDPSSTVTVNLTKRLAFLSTINYSFVLNGSRNQFNKNENPMISAMYKPESPYNNMQDDTFMHPVYSHLGVHIGLRLKLNTSKN